MFSLRHSLGSFVFKRFHSLIKIVKPKIGHLAAGHLLLLPLGPPGWASHPALAQDPGVRLWGAHPSGAPGSAPPGDCRGTPTSTSRFPACRVWAAVPRGPAAASAGLTSRVPPSGGRRCGRQPARAQRCRGGSGRAEKTPLTRSPTRAARGIRSFGRSWSAPAPWPPPPHPIWRVLPCTPSLLPAQRLPVSGGRLSSCGTCSVKESEPSCDLLRPPVTPRAAGLSHGPGSVNPGQLVPLECGLSLGTSP